MSTDEQWARLADRDHVTAGLVDIAAFLTATAIVEEHLVGLAREFLASADEVGDRLDERDRRIAHSDPVRPAEALADALAWLVDMGVATVGERDRLLALAERRDKLARAPHRALIEQPAGELLAAVLDLRELLRTAARGWYANFEADGTVAEHTEVVCGAEMLLTYIIDIAQNTARP
jgi:hypothetical protein